MGFFGATPPKRVTKDEWQDIMQKLYGKLDEAERSEVEKLFRADLLETGIESGISQTEYTAAIEWLRSNMRKHVLEEGDILLLEQYFREHLKD